MGKKQPRDAAGHHPSRISPGVATKTSKKSKDRVARRKKERAPATHGPAAEKMAHDGRRDRSMTKRARKTSAAASSSHAARVVVGRPPPPYRLRGAPTGGADADPDGASLAMGYLAPSHAEYEACVGQSYVGFHVDEPSVLPPALHEDVERALDALVALGHFHYDVLAAGKTVSPTFVQRTLVGDRGMTYHYQKLRIFAHPWEDAETSKGSPLRVVRRLNDALRARCRALLTSAPDPRLGAHVTGSCEFNVTLINLMEPAEKCVAVPLKEEGLYGMGNASVSWHSDSSLQDMSTVAVYHQTAAGAKSKEDSWHVALKTLDGVTPALRVPLRSHRTYYMLRDFNLHHHHAVLTGKTRRFSSTHRVAVVAKDTFEYIKGRCEAALALLPALKAAAGAENRGRGRQANAKHALESLAKTVQQLGDVHREVEFQWIRMFWLQGERHADSHAGYWKPRIHELTQAWDAMELGYRWALDCLHKGADSGVVELRAYDMMLYLLGEVAELRSEHVKRCASPAYAQVPKDCRPVDAPSFEEQAPLPFNLSPVIATLEGWRARAARNK